MCLAFLFATHIFLFKSILNNKLLITFTMMFKISKSNISLFFVSLFLFFKVAGLHALSHQEDDLNVEHCEICHVTTAVNFTPLLESEAIVLPEPVFFIEEQKQNGITPYLVFVNDHVTSYHFTRPPPLFL